MIVTLDGQKVTRQFAADDTLQDIIDAVRADQPTTCLVVGVAIDGSECDVDELGRRLNARVAGVEQIDLESSDPRELAANALGLIAEQMRGLGQSQVQTAEQLNAGDVVQAMPRISEFVGVWQMVQQVIAQVTRLTDRDIAAESYDGRPISTHLDSLLVLLHDIRDALDGRDLVTLADLLQYETPTLCETWGELLDDLAGRFQRGFADNAARAT